MSNRATRTSAELGRSAEDEATGAESGDELAEVMTADSSELSPAEDYHLGESGGVKPAAPIPAPRVPDPPAPAAADRETLPPDDPHDFDLPPTGQPQEPWQPPL